MKKRILAVVLLVAMLLNALPAYAAPADPAFRVETVSAAPGETVEVTIWVDNNPGIASIKLQVNYDPALVLNAVTYNPVLGNNVNIQPTWGNPAVLNWYSPLQEQTGDWYYATMTFAVAEDVALSTYPITISYDPDDVYNMAEDNVNFAIVNGGVVVEEKPVAVSGVTLDKDTISLTEGESAVLTAVVAPVEAADKSVTFTSSDPAVATVDAGGKVTAVKKGTATITVMTSDGGFTDSCQVTVACPHGSKTITAAKDSDCKVQGWDAYKTCNNCGQLFDTDDNEISAIPHRPLSTTHIGGTATCTKPAVCEICGAEYGQALPHAWTDATCEAPKTCTSCGLTEGEALGHQWVEATCTTPKTCTVCGKTEGEALGHKPDREEATEELPVICTVCNETLQPALGHTHKGEMVEAKEPTCTEDGNKTYYVCRCGKWFADSTSNVEIVDKNSVTLQKLGHKWNNADCESAKTCTVCGYAEGEALGHTWADATCETPKTCTVCGKTEGKALPHQWVAATCEASKICNLCGLTEGEALGHQWADATCEAPKTCTACGKTEGQKLSHQWEAATCEAPVTCALCGKTDGEALGHIWTEATCEAPKTCSVCDKTEGEALPHKWNNATCTAPKTCDVCGKTEGEKLSHTPDRPEPTEELPVTCIVCGETLQAALGHTHHGVAVEAVEATCTEAGHSAYYECRCGMWFADAECKEEITDKSSVVIEAAGHKWSFYSSCTKPKTCTVCGVVKEDSYRHFMLSATCTRPKRCLLCGLTEGEPLGHKPDRAEPTGTLPVTCTVCDEILQPALGHSHKVERVAAKEPTCTETGYKSYYVCGCGMWFADADGKEAIADKDSVIIEKLSHTWLEATCETPKTCAVCGEAEGEALGHKWTDATCTAPKACSVCGKTEGQKLSHTPDRAEPTETDPVKCTVCGETLKPALGHSHKGEQVPAKAPTCTEDGNEAYYVCKCGKWFVDSTAHIEIVDKYFVVIEKLGHEWETATCETPVTCARCGKTEGEALGHSWVDATCTTPKTCSICDKTEGEALGHKPDRDEPTETDPVKCTVCGETLKPALGHTHRGEKVAAKEPTCTEDGHKTYYTCGCGKWFADSTANVEITDKTSVVTKKLGHKWADATCEAPKTCSQCGKTEGAALGHKWTDATCEAPKTCTTCGKTEGAALGHKWADATCETAKTCAVCGKTEGAALGHKWVEATCTAPKTCSVCGKTEGEALGHTPDRLEATEEHPVVCTVCGITLQGALGHTHGAEAVAAKEPTCTEDGHKAYYICECGMWFADADASEQIVDKTAVVIEKLGHKWTDATCDAPKTCDVCGKTEGKALGHKWTAATCETAKTCSVCHKTEGEALGHKWIDATCTTAKFCSVCGKTEGEALGHKWIDATCTAPKTCDVCGKTEGQLLDHTPDRAEPTETDPVKCVDCGEILKPALGHTHKLSEVAAKEPTCTEAGNKAYYTCACGMWFADAAAEKQITDKNSVVILKLDHKWTAATCETAKTCSACGETEGEALGHNWTAATCEAPKTCKLCGKTEGKALGHTPDRAEPTEIDAVKCSVCGETLEPELGHTHLAEKVAAKEPTCTENGCTTYYACKCGKWFADSTAHVEITDKSSVIIEKLGHKWTDATCTAPKTCSVCGDTEGQKLGHKWLEATCETPKTCSACGKTEGKALGHKWTDATCETPKTCSVCDKTEGQALGHKWTDATCETPKTCKLCGKTEGEALGHKWIDATCEAPKTCSVCHETEGKVLAHTPDRAEPTETDPVKCKVCGMTLQSALGHTHAAELVAAKEPTCTQFGNREYYFCDCGMWFADAAATQQITDKSSVVIKKLGHQWLDATCEAPETCERCGQTEGEALGHRWQDATCVSAKSCSVCGKIEGEALGHQWLDATCEAPKTCAVCGETEGEKLAHVWVAATCETPLTCALCGETEGEKLGHKWQDATCETPKTCIACGKTEGEALGHKWLDATCDSPKTCAVCGEIQGEAREHKWEDATCETPKTCSLCGKTEGEALGHKWEDATCETPKTCNLCGKTEGEALGHKPDRDEPTETDPVKCEVCGDTLKPMIGHTHMTTKVEGREPTCTEAGRKTYYMCKCGMWFADSTANVEILDKTSVIIGRLGHKWLDATCEAPETCEHCGLTKGEALGHSWLSASCEAPRTCEHCGMTEGEALGHKWKDAACTEPKTCENCGLAEGEALDHKWLDATCEAPKTCERCGLTEGEKLGHGETELKSNGNGHWEVCKDCGEMVSERTYTHVDADDDQKCDDCDHVIVPGGNPQTGDMTIHLLAAAMLMSLMGVSVLVLLNKKRRV